MGGDCRFSSHASNSRGVTILFRNSFQYEVHKEFIDPNGNYIILDMSIQGFRLSLVALYGPNADCPSFFENVKNKLDLLGNSSVIMAGDWNVPLEYSIDTQYYIHKNNLKSNEYLHTLMDHFDLIDAWRDQHPQDRKFTWFGPNRKRSRLDYFLLSSDLQLNLSNSTIDFAYRSDHSPISIELKFINQVRGRGTWKFNNSLLNDLEYVNLVKETINEVLSQYRTDENENLENATYSIDDHLLWETLKLVIRGKTIQYSSYKKQVRDKKEKQLEEKLQKLYDNTDSDIHGNEIILTETELKELREKRVQGIILRAKARWKVEGEKSSKYFCNLEKRHFIDKTIPKLVLNNGHEIDNLQDIIQEQKRYYETLYTSSNTSITDEHTQTFFDENNPYINKLSNEDKHELEQDIQELDCLKALENMKNGKSPGLDGFTVEFYKVFWIDLKCPLLRSFKYSFEIQSMSLTQRQGLITCLPKDGKSKHFLKNWRPISLLNVDYKLVSACVSNKIKTVLNSLISETQLGFVSGRYIGECSRLVNDLLCKTEEENIPGILLLLDFEKAFDSLEWNFIEKTLTFLNFGPNIIRSFKTLYNNVSSSIQNNGHLSPFFEVKRGVRQGDPLSPYLQGGHRLWKTGKTGKMMKKNSLNGKIREFDKNKKIREKSGNFTLLSKKVD